MQFWAVVLPFDVAKTRIQTSINPKLSRSPIYNMKLVLEMDLFFLLPLMLLSYIIELLKLLWFLMQVKFGLHTVKLMFLFIDL